MDLVKLTVLAKKGSIHHLLVQAGRTQALSSLELRTNDELNPAKLFQHPLKHLADNLLASLGNLTAASVDHIGDLLSSDLFPLRHRHA